MIGGIVGGIIMIGIGIGIPFIRRRSGAAPFQGLLDLYPNAAAAYSLRKLRAAYTGSAVRIRRSSDNAETDIGFLANGDFDSAAAVAFCGVGNGFITTWYDQSGNAVNMIQSTGTAQAKIVDSGVIILDNGKPSLLADGIANTYSVAVTLTNPTTQFFVYNKVNNVGWLAGLLSGVSSAPNLISNATGVQAYQAGPQFSPTYTNNNQALVSLKSATTGTNWAMNGNGASILNSGENIGTLTPNKIQLFSRGNGTQFASTYFQEYIVFNSDKSSDFNGIETNINAYYGIY